MEPKKIKNLKNLLNKARIEGKKKFPLFQSYAGILTVELAKALLEVNTEKNRNIAFSNLKLITQDIRDDRWQMNGDVVRLDWEWNMIDGQYRCQAVIDTGIPIDVVFEIGLDPEAFFSIDRMGKKRTLAEAVSILGYRYSSVVAPAIYHLMAYRTTGNDARSGAVFSQAHKMDALLAETGLADSVERIARIKTIPLPGYMAAYLHIFSQISQDIAEDFVEGLEKGFMDLGRPFNIMRNNIIKIISQNREAHKKRHEILCNVILAWNAEMEGRRPKFFKLKLDGKLPRIIGYDEYLEYCSENNIEFPQY